MTAFSDQLRARVEVDPITGCWLWTGSIDDCGYARLQSRPLHRAGRSARVHRLMYEELAGPIPEGLTLDHLCRVRRCVNPAHLEPCTIGENVRRGTGPVQVYERKRALVTCKRGHALVGANVYHAGGRRHCRECKRIRGRVYDKTPERLAAHRRQHHRRAARRSA